jgi:hypothetical protein
MRSATAGCAAGRLVIFGLVLAAAGQPVGP